MSPDSLQVWQALLSLSSLAALLAAATASDLRSRRIPNRLIVIGLFTAAALHALGLMLPGAALAGAHWWSPLAGAAVGAAVLLPLHLSGGMGAGDVKLMAVAGAFLGARDAAWAALYGLAAAGLACLAVLIWAWLRAMSVRDTRRVRLPYAPLLSCGVALSGWRSLTAVG